MTPEREAKIERVLSQRQPTIVVVMENVNEPHNIMAVARTCDSVGVQTIHVIYDQSQPGFNLKREGSKSSASANKWVDFEYHTSTTSCLQLLKNSGYKILATHLGTTSRSVYEMNFTEKVALVFGNEKHGVSEQVLSHCEENFVIPQVGMIQSLNISVACAVSLYEAFRQRTLAGSYLSSQFSSKDYQEIKDRWSQNK